jgi:hypothetical protein
VRVIGGDPEGIGLGHDRGFEGGERHPDHV